MNKAKLNKEITACLKEQQKEYKYGGNAYNVLRKLETYIPNIVNESLKGEGEKYYKKKTGCSVFLLHKECAAYRAEGKHACIECEDAI